MKHFSARRSISFLLSIKDRAASDVYSSSCINCQKNVAYIRAQRLVEVAVKLKKDGQKLQSAWHESNTLLPKESVESSKHNTSNEM